MGKPSTVGILALLAIETVTSDALLAIETVLELSVGEKSEKAHRIDSRRVSCYHCNMFCRRLAIAVTLV